MVNVGRYVRPPTVLTARHGKLRIILPYSSSTFFSYTTSVVKLSTRSNWLRVYGLVPCTTAARKAAVVLPIIAIIPSAIVSPLNTVYGAFFYCSYCLKMMAHKSFTIPGRV
ncbi:hypothetical protein M422DRAFT_36472 [Sphaerobolus stellatus SS14]|uniref:Uncharacterized protein n=1 Tax=Sphaerobolus stellatus (strain SS14) TaxID=990650 RepID=A0A0C9UZ56_SPHS4|nr:hypothetical protein M422DRAFT_36472 [Sphaerobolus stellatus SS14]